MNENVCIDCGKKICKVSIRCGSCAKKGKNHPMYGKIPWNKDLTKEIDERMKKSSESHMGQKAWNKDKPLSEKHKKGISVGNKGRKAWNEGFGDYIKGEKNPMYGKQQTDETKRKIRGQIKEIMKDPKVRERISKLASTPEAIQQSLRNSYGNKCYYDNEFFPSNAERDCYIELKKLGFKIKHNFEGRFDFLINDKIVVEFHSCQFLDKKTPKQYYKDRRKLLNKYGYKDLKLIVIKDIKEIENKLILEGGLI